jgi:hypothetical protein
MYELIDNAFQIFLVQLSIYIIFNSFQLCTCHVAIVMMQVIQYSICTENITNCSSSSRLPANTSQL